MHGLAYLNDLLLFTDPNHHRICTHNDNQVQTWAGSDIEDSQDGPVKLSSFEQPNIITTELEQNRYIVDTKMGSVKLLVAFGVHIKGKTAFLLQ